MPTARCWRPAWSSASVCSSLRRPRRRDGSELLDRPRQAHRHGEVEDGSPNPGKGGAVRFVHDALCAVTRRSSTNWWSWAATNSTPTTRRPASNCRHARRRRRRAHHRPNVATGMVYATQASSPLLAMRPSDGKDDKPEIVWKQTKGTSDSCCPVAWKEPAVTGSPITASFSAAMLHTGAIKWQERCPGDYKASPLAADGRSISSIVPASAP